MEKDKVVIVETCTKLSDYQDSYNIELFVNDKLITNVFASDLLSECPEDATLGRDLNCIFSVITMIKEAHKFGKNNIEIEYQEKYINDCDGEEVEVTKEEYLKIGE